MLPGCPILLWTAHVNNSWHTSRWGNDLENQVPTPRPRFPYSFWEQRSLRSRPFALAHPKNRPQGIRAVMNAQDSGNTAGGRMGSDPRRESPAGASGFS